MAKTLCYDYSLLKGIMKARNQNYDNIAKSLGISKTTLSMKMCNHVNFTQSEIDCLINVLRINRDLINDIFFTRK